ncbi:MAG: SAM-dependent DNA methyltransferase [Anaerolineales bacterium]|nr:MAG: SAM-dependent DNA methyltransferase [Anaerolineales bacterium]
MLTGEIRNQIDRIWEVFWTGGIANPMEVIEQLTYLLFIKRLDEIETLEEAKANRLKEKRTKVLFAKDKQHLRWSHFRNLPAEELYTVIVDEVFPFIRTLGNGDYVTHMKDARFTLPPEKANLLTKVVGMLDNVPMTDRDTKGDVYEYLLSKLKTSGQNGQFLTPRHIIKMMVELVKPTPEDTICDPACGTAGFLVAAAEYLKDNHPEILQKAALRQRYEGDMFHGFDFDSTMLRIATMNMLLHGIDNPVIRNQDSLSEDAMTNGGQYSVVLANPPFTGSLDFDSTAKDLQAVAKTKKTELLFLALFLRLLKPGGRAAVIVPEGLLFGSSKSHKAIRKTLVEEHQLQAVISMPSGVFKPYAGVSTAVLVFTKTGAGGTEKVWFYQMQADGFSLDDKRTPLSQSHQENNIPDIVNRWSELDLEAGRTRDEQSFFVTKAGLLSNNYDLSINRYKEFSYKTQAVDSPGAILNNLNDLEKDIVKGLEDLQGALNEFAENRSV